VDVSNKELDKLTPTVDELLDDSESTSDRDATIGTMKRLKTSICAVGDVYWRGNRLGDVQIRLYRQSRNAFHPRLNFQLSGSQAQKAREWMDTIAKEGNPYRVEAPYDRRLKGYKIMTSSRFSHESKQQRWFHEVAIPHLVALVLEHDFGVTITGTRKTVKRFYL
jgi:hypothetical protein